MRIWLAVLAGVLAMAAGAPAAAQGYTGFSARIGRASAADISRLDSDIRQVIAAEMVLARNAVEIQRMLNVSRQRELLGSEDASSADLQDLARRGRNELVQVLLPVALNLARNRAANCSVVRSRLTRVVEFDRSLQLVGEASARRTAEGEPTAVGELVDAASQRCLEEAYDECMTTGNGQALVLAMGEWARQLALYGAGQGAEVAWSNRLTYLFRRCTVYQLEYHTELDDTATGETSTIDGHYLLLLHYPQTAAGASNAWRVEHGWWVTRGQDLPGDARLTQFTCRRNATRLCVQEGPFIGGEACSLVLLRRNVVEQTFDIEGVDGSHLPRTPEENVVGARVMVRQVHHTEGQNRLVLQYMPPFVEVRDQAPTELHSEVNGSGTQIWEAAVPANGRRRGPTPAADVDVGRVATTEQRVINETYPCPLAPIVRDNNDQRPGAHPNVYETTHESSQPTTRGGRASARTTFRFVHRPELFPPEWIEPALELPFPDGQRAR